MPRKGLIERLRILEGTARQTEEEWPQGDYQNGPIIRHCIAVEKLEGAPLGVGTRRVLDLHFSDEFLLVERERATDDRTDYGLEFGPDKVLRGRVTWRCGEKIVVEQTNRFGKKRLVQRSLEYGELEPGKFCNIVLIRFNQVLVAEQATWEARGHT